MVEGGFLYEAVAQKWLCDVLALMARKCAVMGSQKYSQEREHGR